MFCNGHITHFNLSDYTRKSYPAYIEEGKGQSTSKDGTTVTYDLYVAVPTTEEIPFKTGDLIVCGEVNSNVSGNTERAFSESMRTLKQNHTVYTISNVEPCLYGSPRMQHYELMGVSNGSQG